MNLKIQRVHYCNTYHIQLQYTTLIKRRSSSKMTSIESTENKRRPEWDRILSASQRNNADEIEFLITTLGVNPNHTNGVGQSSLHVAALWGNISAVEMLLKYRADPNAQNTINGATPLHSAVQSMKTPIQNRTKCIELILASEDCNPHITDFFDSTALVCLQEIMAKGERVDEEDIEFYDEMKHVLSKALSTSDNNRNPIFSMIDDCDCEKVKLFLDENSNSLQEFINEPDMKTGLTPLLLAIEKMFDEEDADEIKDVQTIKSVKEIIFSLLRHGADFNASRTEKTNTKSEKKPRDLVRDICKILSSMHEENDVKNSDTILHLQDVILQLVSNGASLSTPTIRIVHDAARKGNTKTIQFWIEKLGVDLNTKGRQGFTPLHFAARSGKVEVIKYLLNSQKVDLNILNDLGQTALDAAIANKKEAIIQLLQDYSIKDSK